MRRERRWVWRVWVVALYAPSFSLAGAQDSPRGAGPSPNDANLAVAAVVHHTLPLVSASTAPAAEFEAAPPAPVTLFLFTKAAPPPAPLSWHAVVRSSIYGSEEELRSLPIQAAVFDAVQPPHRRNIVEKTFDTAMGSLDWAMRSTMRAARGYTFDEHFDPDKDDRTLTDSFLSMIERPTLQEGAMEVFLKNLLRQEYKFFNKFPGSYMNPITAELGYTSYSSSEVMSAQVNVIIDALQRTLVEQSNLDDFSARVRQEGFELWRYRGKDFILLPPAMAAIVYYRGIDLKFKIEHTSVRVNLCPISDLMGAIHGTDRTACAMGVEVSTPISGISFITYAGLNRGRPELDFVGIGTDLVITRAAIYEAMPSQQN